MKTIWKFPFEVGDIIELEMPSEAIILHVDVQKQITNHVHGSSSGGSFGSSMIEEIPCIWALVNPEAPKEIRKFRLFGTGHPFPDEPLSHVGTFKMAHDKLVFHLFE